MSVFDASVGLRPALASEPEIARVHARHISVTLDTPTPASDTQIIQTTTVTFTLQIWFLENMRRRLSTQILKWLGDFIASIVNTGSKEI